MERPVFEGDAPTDPRAARGRPVYPPGAAWANVGSGILLAAVAFVFPAGEAAFWNALVAGIVVTALAVMNMAAAGSVSRPRAPWPAMLNALVGIWVVMFPFTAGVGGLYRLATVALGLVIALLGAWNAYASLAPDRRAAAGRRPSA